MARFVYKRIVTRFGIPFEIISDNILQFISEVIEKLMKKLSIKHRVTTIYKPNTNGLVEHTNKVMCNILSKEVDVCKNLHNWDKQVHHALWVYNSTFKLSIGFTSFRFAYGVESIAHWVWSNDISHNKTTSIRNRNKRLLELVELEESQLRPQQVIELAQAHQKIFLIRGWRHRSSRRAIWLWCR